MFEAGGLADEMGVYNGGHFTAEAWSCQVREYSAEPFGRYCYVGVSLKILENIRVQILTLS
jgi:hypothetical protein